MAVLDASLREESRERYLTYAMSVVSGRALPDVRDGLKPVQRRILYAMLQNLNLRPTGSHKKSAAVVGEVLAKFHPHGDAACYEAMVRMAQDFSLRYPLVDGQGNFGSLDGDSAAAYRYTEAKLREIAIDVVGEIDEETVDFRDNFDASTVEPVVFPSRVPNLLINGASGIAVGMATSIPPHNLREVIKGVLELASDPDITVARLTSVIRAPDFPTGCQILNSKKEIEEVYRTGRGSIRMRGEWNSEELERGKQAIVITSIPYAVNKAQLVERIANLIIERKVPQLVDVRDESTEVVRVVLELAPQADPELAIAYIFKNTPLETNFPVNLTVLNPSGPGGSLRPENLSLKGCLQAFLDFRKQVTERRLQFEKKKLLERIHILEGLVIVFDALDEVIAIVRKSDGRSDSAEKLRKRFGLSEIQSFAIVDMRIYQLSRTNILEIRQELKEKESRVQEINRILASAKAILDIVRADLENIAEKYGDRRKSTLVKDNVDIEFNAEAYVVQEDVFAIVSVDGWIKRIRRTNELSGTRVREGDSIARAHAVSTIDSVTFFTNQGSMFSIKALDFPASSGFGSPVQKILKFRDEERVIESFGVKGDGKTPSSPGDQGGFLQEGATLLLVSASGVGFGLQLQEVAGLKRSGKRVIKLREGDPLAAVGTFSGDVALVTRKGYALVVPAKDIPVRDSAAVGVNLLNVGKDDQIVGVIGKPKKAKLLLSLSNGKTKEIEWSSITKGHRGLKGNKIISQGEIVGITDAAVAD